MMAILVRAACFAAVIVIGAVLRRTGFFKKEDFTDPADRSLRVILQQLFIDQGWVPGPSPGCKKPAL